MQAKLIHTAADPVRLAFVHVFNKRPALPKDDGTPGVAKFEVTAIIQPGGANEKRVNEAIVAAAREKYGDKTVADGKGGQAPNWQVVLRSLDEDRRCLRDGNNKRTPGGDIYDGFEGMKFITARTTKRPGVYDRDRTPLTEEDGRPYSGCYGNVNVDIWALLKKGVKNCIVSDLTGVQFVEDGDAFGGGAAPSKPDDFADLSAGDDDGSAGKAVDDPFG